MKILFIAHESEINGASHSLIGLIDSLMDKCSLYIVVPHKHGPFIDEMRKRNIKIYFVPFFKWVEIKDVNFELKKKRWNQYANKHNQKLAKQLAVLLKKEDIDIIHSNTSVIDFGYRLSKILKIKHIWHIREFGEKDFSMYPLCSDKEYYKKIADHNYLVCVSNEVKKKFEMKVKKELINVIYNGVHKKNLNNNKKYNKNKKEIVCLQTGVISQAKGQEITIKAIDKLVKKGYNIKLLIAGRGNISDININETEKGWLKVLGQVDNMPEIRKNVDIEIVSSRSEAFGRVTIEAMLGGIVVVGSNSGGTKELIKNGENGILFDQGNPDDLAKKIEYLYNNKDELERIGRNAYHFSKDYFLIERCADEIYQLYVKIINR